MCFSQHKPIIPTGSFSLLIFIKLHVYYLAHQRLGDGNLLNADLVRHYNDPVHSRVGYGVNHTGEPDASQRCNILVKRCQIIDVEFRETIVAARAGHHAHKFDRRLKKVF